MSTEQESHNNRFMFVGGPVDGKVLYARQNHITVPVCVSSHYDIRQARTAKDNYSNNNTPLQMSYLAYAYEMRHIIMADGSTVRVYAPPTMSGEDVVAEYERITKEQHESTCTTSPTSTEPSPPYTTACATPPKPKRPAPQNSMRLSKPT